MHEYTKLLALLYFKQIEDKYELSELMQILGINRSQLEDIIIDLKTREYIEYKNYLLSITEKGKIKLASANMLLYEFNEREYESNNGIKQVSINEPYAPEKFLSKYK